MRRSRLAQKTARTFRSRAPSHPVREQRKMVRPNSPLGLRRGGLPVDKFRLSTRPNVFLRWYSARSAVRS